MLFGKKKFDLFFPAFGAHLPGVPQELQEQNVYPLATRTDDGFDLDYSGLLLVDRLIIDKYAYEYLCASNRSHLTTMKASVTRLADEGLLKCKDYKAIVDKHRNELVRRVDELLEVPEYWLSTARTHWRLYKAELPELVRRYGTRADPAVEHLHFGVYCHLKQTGSRLDFTEARRLHNLLESRRRRLTTGEAAVFREIVKPLITHVVFMRLLMGELGNPFLDWNDLQCYYSKLDLASWELRTPAGVSKAMLEKCRELFRVGLPELRPNSLDEVLTFIRHRSAVRSLKAELRRAIEQRQQFDVSWARQLRDDANRAQITARKRQRVISWLGLSLGGIPLEGLSTAAEAMAEAGTAIVEQGGSTASDKVSLKRFHWYYALLSVKTHAK